MIGQVIPECFRNQVETRMKMVCKSFKPLRKNTMLGFCEIYLSDLDLTMKDIALHEKSGSRWAAPPARPQISKDGAVIRDESTGKIAYSPIIEFTSRNSRDEFSKAVIAAVCARVPGVFAEIETDEPCF
jgi:hypothetical protein